MEVHWRNCLWNKEIMYRKMLLGKYIIYNGIMSVIWADFWQKFNLITLKVIYANDFYEPYGNTKLNK